MAEGTISVFKLLTEFKEFLLVIINKCSHILSNVFHTSLGKCIRLWDVNARNVLFNVMFHS